MSTRKLYYEDPYLTSFSATVLSCTPTADGCWVTLDATAFYPEGGGQSWDTGTLDSAKVLKVLEKEETVCHLCDRPLEVGATVSGHVSMPPRFDQMQQHTAEHILSGLVFDAFGFQNSGFHMGNDVMEVDFDGIIPQKALPELEAKANRAIWENLPVSCTVPSPETLAKLTYRTKRALPWPVRIVEIPGYDSCACCGLHVAHTGEIGFIKILSSVKFRGGVRMEVVSGQRAYRYMTAIWEQNRTVSQCLSAHMTQTGNAAIALKDALAAEKFRANGLQEQLFAELAKSYRGKENVLHFAKDLTPAAVRSLADAIAAQCTGIAAVLSQNGESCSYALVSSTREVASLGKEMAQALSCRGGGKPNAQQGTIQESSEEIAAFFASTGLF